MTFRDGALGGADIVDCKGGRGGGICCKLMFQRPSPDVLLWPEKIVLESSPVGESQSNGGAECAIQLVQGQFRIMKDSLEALIGTLIAEDSPIVPWIVIHAARTLNRFAVGTDGRTAYQRWKGKEFKRSIAEFGESVM